MIELTILKHLQEKLDVDVSLTKRDPVPSDYVVFEKTGSNKVNHLQSSVFAFQSISTSQYETVLLNQQVKEAVESLIELDEIVSVRLNSDYNFPDLTTKQYRYQAVFDITHY